MVSEGYKLKMQHYRPKWREALEAAEEVLIDNRTLDNLDDYYIDELVDIRAKARMNKNWELADRLRDYLDTKSVIIMDTKDGQIVHYLTGNKTRQDLIDKQNKERKLIALQEAWLYTIKAK